MTKACHDWSDKSIVGTLKILSITTTLLVFRIERPILGDNPKSHKFAFSGRLLSSVTEA